MQIEWGYAIMRKLGAAGAALLLLVGCQGSGIGRPGSPAWFATTPPAEQAAYFRDKCVAYGFQVGTLPMAQCIQNESISSKDRAQAKIAAASASLANSGPKTTTCNRFGNTVNCTTY